ncbi:hypothetical protein B5E53_04230 [Eubacterium sp. An11]|uniref:hypothetical protein n=1 Tax=Eubacterium sp. An11 TaxID=1965542 RepID=UPI000B37FA46|nr:hypothetical protein [Eubacterium sp. An11]OUQ69313.1 hypothetical protein B5E53_04230 [Eubacterium sp. An11]
MKNIGKWKTDSAKHAGKWRTDKSKHDGKWRAAENKNVKNGSPDTYKIVKMNLRFRDGGSFFVHFETMNLSLLYWLFRIEGHAIVSPSKQKRYRRREKSWENIMRLPKIS